MAGDGAITWAQRLVERVRGVPIERDLRPYRRLVARVAELEPAVAAVGDAALAGRAARLRGRALLDDDEALAEGCALIREVARRTVGLRAFDTQVLAGVALCRDGGRLVELQTGEGKTLAAVFPACLHALGGRGVHLLTFNDYLARRDAAWMGPVYRFLGLTVDVVQGGLDGAARRAAYGADVVYATAKQVGFDLLRSSLALDEAERTLPYPLESRAVVIDEADALLVDEARVPIVIAGAADVAPGDLRELASLAAELDPAADFEVGDGGRAVVLTDRGLERCEARLGCGGLHAPRNLERLTALHCALHAQALLGRDVDYIVREGRIEVVDEHTGRVVKDRQWPAGLQAALEAKEGLEVRPAGVILGSVTVHHLLDAYGWAAGTTATAQAAATEIGETYGLATVVVPTNRPCVRVDHPDWIFATAEAKARALVAEIARVHATGQPVLVGTRTVEESERLAADLERAGVEVRVLNARHDEREAAIVAEAGRLGAVTIATNMAGRGTDIRLGGADGAERARVEALGGLHVIGTNRHESRRIDDQLRGRAGRQGDPGSSRFVVSLDDDLLQRYGVARAIPAWARAGAPDGRLDHGLVRGAVARAQRIIEGQHHAMRQDLRAYSAILEDQRLRVQARRDELLADRTRPEALRALTLTELDRRWSEHLAFAAEQRETIFLERLAGREPVVEFCRRVGQAFESFDDDVEQAVSAAAEAAGGELDAARLKRPAATWTYLVDDDPSGDRLGEAFSRSIGLGAWAALLWPLLLLWALGRLLTRKRSRAS